MARCIIHIGMHKTGSTSIQKSLDAFENDRFLYAKLGDSPNHSLPIFSAFSANPERHHLHRARGRGEKAIRDYIDQVSADLDRSILAARGRTLLISGEDIGVLNEHGLTKLRDDLSRRVDDVRIVGYARSPGAFMASSFQQTVKGASIKSFDPKRIYRNYQASFGKFDAVFGRDKVQLWKFDPTTFPGGCVVQDFCARMGIDLPKQRIVRLNESLSREAVCVLYTYVKLAQELGSRSLTGPEAMKVGGLLGGLGKFRFSPDVVRPVLAANRADIEWMEARLGQSLDEDLGEHRPGDVRDESDLLRPDPNVVAKLLDLLEEDAPNGVKGETPNEVALLAHAVVRKYIPEGRFFRRAEAREVNMRRLGDRSAKGGGLMIQPSDLVEQIRKADPALLNGISPPEAEGLIRNMFKNMNEQVEGTEAGVVSFAGLGRFRVDNVERDVNGKRTMQRRVVFRPAERGKDSA